MNFRVYSMNCVAKPRVNCNAMHCVIVLYHNATVGGNSRRRSRQFMRTKYAIHAQGAIHGVSHKQKPPKRRFTFSAVFLHIISTSKQPLRVVRGIYRSRTRFRPAVSVVVKPLLIAKFQQELLQFIRYGTSSVPVR